MKKPTPLTRELLKHEIEQSHQRSKAMGISAFKRGPGQKKLTGDQLAARREAFRDLMEVGREYIEEFYDLLSPEQFITAIVDNQGYVLHIAGSRRIISDFAKHNYAPGFRFTEKDVGTTATSLCLEKQIPVQINDKEHFYKRAQGYTSSAAPIFEKDGRLHGVLVVSGKNALVHPHTLVMIASAARSIEKQIRLVRRNRELSETLSGARPYFTFGHLVGGSPGFTHTLELARRAAETDSTVLLMGETGTGKELFAQAIHNAGPKNHGPFIPVNCGAIPAELMESEMFGYVHGAFSGALKGGRPGKFELADGGTLLLDEIGDMPHNMQVKLLRVLQTGEIQSIGSTTTKKVRVRIIAATNVNLVNAIKKKRFRQDLYYRLNILPITIPPLRDRGEADIRNLASHFIKKYNPGCRLNHEAAQLLAAYDWPGNVRELENTIQQAIHLSDGKELTPEHLNLPDHSEHRPSFRRGAIRDMERDVILSTLEANGFNMAKAAPLLGISRATLYRKVKEFGIKRPG